jgi:glycosyltransferase involved in cell wall biosynthesis
MPVFERDLARPRATSVMRMDKKVSLAATYPYSRVTEYMRKLPMALARNMPALRREIRAADLVWIRLPAANGPLAFLLSKLYRKPVVVFLVAYPAAGELVASGHSRLRSALVRGAARMEWRSIATIARRSLVFAYGNDLAARVREKGAPRVHVTFTSLVHDVPSTVCQAAPPHTARLLFAGRFAPEKGIDLILDAARLLGDQGYAIHVDLVGDGALAHKLRNHPFAASGSSVSFHGWIHDDIQLDKFFQQADIFVHPSRSEGIPKVLLKAMAHGLPIVTTRVGGIPDIVQNGVNGLLVPPNETAPIAQAIGLLLSDSAYSRKLGDSAREFARQHTSTRQADLIWLEIMSNYPDIFPTRTD